MSDTTQAPQKKADQRKIMTPEKLERLRLAREKRAHNQLLREEKRMELAKQMVLASVTPAVPAMSTQTIKMLDEKKTSPEEKKLKWDARKEAMIQEMLQKIGEANVLAMKRAKEAKEPEPEPESESEFSDMEEPPAKRPKKSKPPVAKSKKTKKSSSHTATSVRAQKRRKPVEPAVYSTSESDSESDVEHENVLQLW